MDYTPNPLNDYMSYTYNIQIYMINPTLLGSDIDPIQSGILMADNAQMAEFSISSVTHTYNLDPGHVRTSIGSYFDIVIEEQNGAQFFESMLMSANYLGIPKHLDAAYAIVIKFKGRKEDNMPNEFNQIFKYFVTFKNVGVKINNLGSTYNISAVETHVDAFEYLRGVEKLTLTYDALTVGEAVSILEKKLKDAITAAWELDPNAEYPYQIAIEFDEDTKEWAKWDLEKANAPDIEKNDKTHIGDKINMSIFSGTTMHEYLARILEKTENYKKIPTYPNGYAKDNGPDQPTTQSLSSIKYGFKIITNVENLNWDVLRQDYQKRITFRIKKHLYPNWIIDSSEYLKTINSPTEQLSRLSNLKKAGLLRKRYDYLFTGKNTEVMSLDLSFDMTYYVISPIGGGIYGDPNVVKPKAGKDTASTIERIRANKQKMAANARMIDNLSSLSVDSGIIRRLEINSDLIRSNFRAELGNMTTTERQTSHPTPIKFAPDIVDDSALYHSPGQETGAAIQFGAAKMNLENTRDLASLEMTIRGDPYWLGKPNGFLRTKNNRSTDFEAADYELGGAMFYLHVKFPKSSIQGDPVLRSSTVNTPAGSKRVVYRTFSDDDGRMKPSISYSYSGVYQVHNVINEFRGGLFKQTLKAFRDVSLNPSIINESADNTSSNFIGPR